MSILRNLYLLPIDKTAFPCTRVFMREGVLEITSIQSIENEDIIIFSLEICEEMYCKYKEISNFHKFCHVN